MQPDGKVLVGGAFGQIADQPRCCLARLNPDGSLDAGFNPRANNTVSTLTLQPDGKILVGGRFSQIGGEPRDHIARLNPDGSLNAGFDPGASDGYVSSLAVQPDGKVLVGGTFTQIGGQPHGSIARLNADGSLDAAFNPDPDGSVLSLAVQPDGKVLAGGLFTQLGGRPRSHLARMSLPEVAQQSLTAENCAALWRRSGAGPELALPPELLLSYSGDPGSFMPLGTMQRVHGGWRLGGFAPPADRPSFLRARGRVGGSQGSGLIETTACLYRDEGIFRDGFEEGAAAGASRHPRTQRAGPGH